MRPIPKEELAGDSLSDLLDLLENLGIRSARPGALDRKYLSRLGYIIPYVERVIEDCSTRNGDKSR